MLRPLPFEAVRKQHDEAARAQPLGFAGGDELIDDALRAVGEVAELRLPQHQSARVGERKAIFEAEHSEFRERAVANLELSLAFDVAQRDVFLTRLLIEPHRVALAERASTAVLARQSDAIAFGQQASKRERFGGRP